MPAPNTIILHFKGYHGGEPSGNVSLQPGDHLYATDLQVHNSGHDVAHLNQETQNPFIYLGVCAKVDDFFGTPNVYIHPINPDLFPSAGGNPAIPARAKYVMFTKNRPVNTSNLKGYFAEIELRNSSKEKAELFSVGMSVTQSSK